MAAGQEIPAKIKDALAGNPQGLSITDIVKETGINRNTAGRYLDKLLISGQVEMRHFGMAKIYALAHRVPISAVLSISSEYIMQLSGSLRIVFINEAFAQLISTPVSELTGKNIEYTPFVTVFDDVFDKFIGHVKAGLDGTEWSGECAPVRLGMVFSCRIAPTALDNGQKGVSVILEDITEKKRADELLMESEQRYRILAESSNDLIYMIGRDDRVEYVNTFAAGTLGKRPEDLAGKLRNNLFPEEIASRQKGMLEKVFETGKQASEESPLPLHGELRWYDHVLTPVFDEEGHVQSVFGVSRDITRSRQAIDALRISEEKFRRIFEDGPLGMSIIGKDKRFVLVNRLFSRMLGYTREELTGKSFEEVTDPACVSRNRENFDRLYSGELSLIHEEKQYIKKDGTPLWVSITVTPLRDIDGHVLFTISIVEDITERKKAETRLVESERRFRDLAELLPQSVWECDPNGNLTFANEMSFTMYRYTRDDFKNGLSIWQMIDAKDRAIVSAIAMQAFANPPERFPNVIEYTALRKDGSTFPVTMYLSPIVTDGKIAGMRGIGIDKSEIARFETALTESTERFRAIFDSTFQYTGMLTPGGTLIEANHTALGFIGAKREDVIDRLFWETGWWAGDPGRVERLRAAIKKAASGSFVRYDETMMGVGGTVVHADFSLKPVRGSDGNVRLLIAEARDITPQKQAEAALRESEERLRTLLTMTPDIIWQTDARNRFTYVSPQVESVLGYRSEDLVGHEVSLFFEPGCFEKNRDAFVAAAAGHTKSLRVVTCWRDREGRSVHLESHSAPYYAPDGTFAGFSGIDRVLPDKKP